MTVRVALEARILLPGEGGAAGASLVAFGSGSSPRRAASDSERVEAET